MFCIRCGAKIDEKGYCQNPECPNIQSPNQYVTFETYWMATASLACGVLSLFCLWPLAILGVIFGHVAINDIQNSNGKLHGLNIAQWGTVISWISVITLFIMFLKILSY
ncbi:MAG: DUF4190 domain-containing protein [archaeon]